MADVLIACTNRAVSAIGAMVRALQGLEVYPEIHLDDENPPSAYALEHAVVVLVLMDPDGKPGWAIDVARVDSKRFVFVTFGDSSVALPGETIPLAGEPGAAIVDRSNWALILKSIGPRLQRPGLDEYLMAEAAGDAEAMDAWLATHLGDALALRALPAVARKRFNSDDGFIDHRVTPFRVDRAPGGTDGMAGLTKSFGGQDQAAAGSSREGARSGGDYVVYTGADEVGSARLDTGIDFAERTVSMLYATDRQRVADLRGPNFNGERADALSYGGAVVRVPEAHRVGRLELPFKLSILSWDVFTMPADASKHFILKHTEEMTEAAWCSHISAADEGDILIFVHGFNTEFEQAALHFAQIAFDLQCKAIPILYSWPSRGNVRDYRYDDESTNISKDRFASLLTMLAGLPNAKRIHVLAHSMGNKVLLEALAQLVPAAPSGIAEVMMAAPDVDSIRFKQIAGSIRTIVKGMTLYASSADKALALSKQLSGRIARAGDVPPEGPVVVPGVEAIDVTALGAELFGLNHATFAESRSILNDVHLVMTLGTRPPNARLPELLSVPLGAATPTHWKYAD